jgi:uncharacterized membrane protein
MTENRDLKLIRFAAITLFLVVVFVSGGIIGTLIQSVLAIPLLFLLVGHTVLRAVGFTTVKLTEYVAYAIGVSVSTIVGGGFILNMIGALTPTGWAIWLLAVIAATSRIAWNRPYTLPDISMPPMKRWHVLVIIAAIVVTAGAYGLAVYDEAHDREFKYTEFWMLPKSGTLLVGMKNEEANTITYDIEIVVNKQLVSQWHSIRLKPGETFTRPVDISPGQRYKAEAKLYLHDEHVLYRRVSTVITGE